MCSMEERTEVVVSECRRLLDFVSDECCRRLFTV